MLIVFANQKGGVGKSTIAMLFASYLGIHGRMCCMLDCDRQMSILKKYRDDLECKGYHVSEQDLLNPKFQLPENPDSLFKIQRLNIKQLSISLDTMWKRGVEQLVSEDNDLFLFDMPGQLDLELMHPIFRIADAIITPTAFTDFDNDSTRTFVDAIDCLKVRAQKFIVPNNISSIINYSKRPAEERYYQSKGFILTPDIPKTVNLTRGLNTMGMHRVVYGMVQSTFDYILKTLHISVDCINEGAQ